ncbi:AT-rich interactive domain-containing protein 3A-like isoform X1 [Liolophura sinensis]|uniref:AT-rich interactive domain-containing protein 3A-like isoform X1 n=1 Tax=Liolophura sinensis TaxID=3198878 RepID=UPI00315923F2
MMANSESSRDGSMPNEDINESDMESENGVENGDEEELNTDKMDPADRELYEKLKRQEREEREEIERELKAHKEAIARHQEIEELRAKELRLHAAAERLHPTPVRERGERERDRDSERELHRKHNGIDLRSPSRNHATDNGSLTPRDIKSELSNVYGHTAYLDRSYPKASPAQSPSSSLNDVSPSHHWSFQEQFKQLYEINEDPKRREFLDDLFSFMQKRGTPVNRIPIMAKQTLDLYELFRLVVSKGGLVEVINKKLWREITKGLNLPSSITSAAFTLRTQYMKYLYPYECEKLKLSNPAELQAAIDGNRREGRRSSFGYDLSPGPTLLPTTHPHLNASLINGKLSSQESDSSPKTKLWRGNWSDSLAHLPSVHRAMEPAHDDDSLPPTPTPIRVSERDAIAMEAASRAMEEATRKMEAASRAASLEDAPPRKRLYLSEEERLMAHAGMPSCHLKITSRNDGRCEIDNSLVVSMEINGIMYQGVLFAQHPRRL